MAAIYIMATVINMAMIIVLSWRCQGYLQLRGKLRAGDGQHWRSSDHLVPFFGNLGISEIKLEHCQRLLFGRL